MISDFEMRCPQGKKNKLYKRAKLEKFAHYLMKDGLVSRLSVYENRECKFVLFKRYSSVIWDFFQDAKWYVYLKLSSGQEKIPVFLMILREKNRVGQPEKLPFVNKTLFCL